MRRIITAAVVVLFVFGVVYAVMAQEETDTSTGVSMSQDKTEASGWGKAKDRMMHHLKDKRDKGMGTIQMAMGTMMQKEMVSSGDGGVIVLTGNRLLKYDKDLTLLKEVELPMMDMKAMHDRMMEMMKNCSMKMQEEEGEEGAQESAETITE